MDLMGRENVAIMPSRTQGIRHMISPGDVIPYIRMCQEEGVSLQRGMNFRLHGGTSVILMSLRRGAPYADRVEEEGKVLIYEGHDAPSHRDGPDPKSVDQPMRTPAGKLTQNGLFFEAAQRHRRGEAEAEPVRVYEKIKQGIWVYAGVFRLVDAWQETSNARQVFKLRLELADASPATDRPDIPVIEHTRVIPTAVKLAVWKRDGGCCVKCGSTDNLHFDHIIPYSKGGSSLVAENIQLLCARHNLEKRDRIE